MYTAKGIGLTDEAIELARQLCSEAGLDTMTAEAWPTSDNQLWADERDEADTYNAAAVGDVSALVRLRSSYGLPIFV